MPFDLGTGTAAFVSTTTVWQTWNTAGTTSINVNVPQSTTAATTGWPTTAVWQNWNQTYVTGSAGTSSVFINQVVPMPAPAFRMPSKRAMRRSEAKRQREKRARERERHKRNRPERRAETLLLKALARPQRLTWLKYGYFEFNVKQRRYRIKRGRVGNVYRLDAEGGQRICYCCHPRPNVPDSDTAMAQWLMLMHNEEAFISMANVHWGTAENDQTIDRAA